jgi:GGDEF domain-containing protein
VWIADVSSEPGFQRASIAADAGLRGAFAFPTSSGGRCDGVMEFYIRYIRGQIRRCSASSIRSDCRSASSLQGSSGALLRLALDFLTGLPNRNPIQPAPRACACQGRAEETPMALLFIDLDGWEVERLRSRCGRHLLVTLRNASGNACVDRTLSPGTAARTLLRASVATNCVADDEFGGYIAASYRHRAMLAAAAKPFDLPGAGRVAQHRNQHLSDDGRDIDTLTKCADTALVREQAGRTRTATIPRDSEAEPEVPSRRSGNAGPLESAAIVSSPASHRILASFEAIARWP